MFPKIQDLFSAPVPHKDDQSHTSITLTYFKLCHFIENAHKEPETAEISISQAKHTLLRLAPLYEGEKICRLLDYALASPSPTFPISSPSDESAFSRYEYDKILAYRMIRMSRLPLQAEDCIESAQPLLENASYAFHCIHFDKNLREIFWLYSAHNITEHPRFLEQRKQFSEGSSFRLAELASQFYGVKFQRVQSRYADPFLEHSCFDKGVWSLTDIDYLIGKTGTAEAITKWRTGYQHHLYNLIIDAGAFDAKRYGEEIEAHMRDFVDVARRKYSEPTVHVLTPDEQNSS